MRILNRKEFLQLAGQHLFCKYSPQVTEDLEILRGSCGENDFYTDQISGVLAVAGDSCGVTSQMLHDAEKDSTLELPVEYYATGRDGCFEEDQLFLVYSKKDVRDLIKRLQWML
jgi:hypothetical protein